MVPPFEIYMLYVGYYLFRHTHPFILELQMRQTIRELLKFRFITRLFTKRDKLGYVSELDNFIEPISSLCELFKHV